jgi:hypothetical protein
MVAITLKKAQIMENQNTYAFYDSWRANAKF